MKKLIKEIHANALRKGFWENDFKLVCKASVKDGKILKTAFTVQKIALIISELGESIEALRRNNFGYEKKDTFEDEIADTMIRLLDLCGGLEIDIEKQMKWKMAYNEKRPQLHNKEF